MLKWDAGGKYLRFELSLSQSWADQDGSRAGEPPARLRYDQRSRPQRLWRFPFSPLERRMRCDSAPRQAASRVAFGRTRAARGLNRDTRSGVEVQDESREGRGHGTNAIQRAGLSEMSDLIWCWRATDLGTWADLSTPPPYTLFSAASTRTKRVSTGRLCTGPILAFLGLGVLPPSARCRYRFCLTSGAES